MTTVSGTILIGSGEPGTPAKNVRGRVRVTHVTELTAGTLAASWQPITIGVDGAWTVDALPIAETGVGYWFEFFENFGGEPIVRKAIAVPNSTPIDFDTALPMYPSASVPGYVLVADLVADAEAAAAAAAADAATVQAIYASLPADLGTTDAQVAALVGNPASLTGAALDAGINNGLLVVALVGQSNLVGAALDSDPAVDTQDARVFQYAMSGANSGQIIPATRALYHPFGVGDFGFGLGLGKLIASSMDRPVLLVPLGKSGTVFESSGEYVDTWKPGGTPLSGGVRLYDDVAKPGLIAALTAAGPFARLYMVAWHQGESDGVVGTSQATYSTDMDLFISTFRTDFDAEDVPFVLGPMVPEGVVDVSGRGAIQLAHIDTPRRKELTAWFTGPTDAYRTYLSAPDTTHYSANGQRQLARGYFDGRARAALNHKGESAKAPTDVAVAVSATGVVTITWAQSQGRVTDYVVQTRGVTGADWETLTRPANDLSTVASQSGAALGTVVEARVAAVNEAGTSSWSATGRGAAIVAPTPAVSQLSSTSVSVTWVRNPLASSYRVDRKLNSGSTWTLGSVLDPSLSSTTISGLSAALWNFRFVTFTPYGSTSSTVTADFVVEPIAGLTATPSRAYGMRRILSGGSGNVVRVRRSSDSTEQDFGVLSGGGLDIVAVSSFIGSGDGSVTTLFDQGSVAGNIAQATAAAQPKLATSGALLTLNAKPAIQFDGVDDYLFSTIVGAYAAGATSVFLVTQGTPAMGVPPVNEGSSASSIPYYQMIQSNRSDGRLDTTIRNDAGVTTNPIDGTGYLPQAFTSTPAQITLIDTGSSIIARVNGAQVGTRTYARSGTVTLDRFTIGAFLRTTAASFSNIKVAELIVFYSAVSMSDRDIVEANQKAYYGTP